MAMATPRGARGGAWPSLVHVHLLAADVEHQDTAAALGLG